MRPGSIGFFALATALACLACSHASTATRQDASDEADGSSQDGSSQDGRLASESGSMMDSGATVTAQMVYMVPVDTPLGPSPNYEVGLANLDGTGTTQLTSDGKFKFLPHFSPDGTQIVYTRFEVGSYPPDLEARADVAVFDIASSTETLVTSGGSNVDGTWSPDSQRVAYLSGTGPGFANGVSSIWIVNANGSNRQQVASAAGTPDDQSWGDLAWSSTDWILFSVTEACGFDGGTSYRVRTDKIRPDGTSRTKVSDGGPYCTPPGLEQSGDADMGWSHDGTTIYSSRGLPFPLTGALDAGVSNLDVRRLYSFSSDAWSSGKPETDLSLPSEPNCSDNVPKPSPDGTRILLFRACLDYANPTHHPGIYVADSAGSYRTFVADGFGADWNPVAR